MKKICPICGKKLKNGKCMFCGFKTEEDLYVKESFDDEEFDDFTDEEDDKSFIDNKKINFYILFRYDFWSIIFPWFFILGFGVMPIGFIFTILKQEGFVPWILFMFLFVFVGIGAFAFFLTNFLKPKRIKENGKIIKGKVYSYIKTKSHLYSNCIANVIIIEDNNTGTLYGAELKNFKKPFKVGNNVKLIIEGQYCLIEQNK